MPCELRIRDDLSLNDIARLARDHDVKVTPHVGNWTPARLILPTLGISILCVDQTIGEKDRNAHPHLLIEGGTALELCGGDSLTTHSFVTRNTSHKKGFPLGTSLSGVHVGTLRSLYPSAHIVTHSEHLRSYRDLTLAVLEEVTGLSRSAVWWRKVDSAGIVTRFRSKDLPRTWKEIQPDIYPLTNPWQGWLIHNRVSILMDVILQSRMGTEPEIYHLSGPDMVRYLGGEMATISRMYDHVRTRIGLPQEKITFNLVPFASFRFATRTSQAPACERLCEELVRETPDEDIIRLCKAVAFDVLAESETRDYFTQHDCMRTGERVIVPERARDWSMATCAQHLAAVRAA